MTDSKPPKPPQDRIATIEKAARNRETTILLSGGDASSLNDLKRYIHVARQDVGSVESEQAIQDAYSQLVILTPSTVDAEIRLSHSRNAKLAAPRRPNERLQEAMKVAYGALKGSGGSPTLKDVIAWLCKNEHEFETVWEFSFDKKKDTLYWREDVEKETKRGKEVVKEERSMRRNSLYRYLPPSQKDQ
jgi:hypothetical protein